MKYKLLRFSLLSLLVMLCGNIFAETLTVDFEEDASTYTAWEFTNFVTKQTNSGFSAHGGSYFGTTNSKESGALTTKEPIANPQSITFYISKASTNKTASSWLVQVSADKEEWTTVGDEQPAGDGITKGTWTEVSRNLSNYTNVYVRIAYSGTTAVRTIDDVTLTYGAATPAAVATPVIAVDGEPYGMVIVTITCETEGAAIYYTLDGTEPTAESTAYTAPFSLYETATVKAIAFNDGAASAVATKVATVYPILQTVEALNALDNGTKFQYDGKSLLVVAKPTDKYLYVKDFTGSSLIYDNSGQKTTNAEIGKFIEAGWTGYVNVYNKLFEAVPDEALTVYPDLQEDVTYETVDLSYITSDHINEIVKIEGVTYTVSNKDLTITKDDATVAGRNQFGLTIAAAEDGKTYDMVGAISRYNDNIQFQPITITEEPITSVQIKGALASDTNWAEMQTFDMVKGAGNVYTTTIDLTTTLENVAFKLVVNGDNWIGFGGLTVDPEGLELTDGGGDNHNFILTNKDYQTYTVTATWEGGTDAATGWTLKVEGKDARVLKYYLVGDLTGGWPEGVDDADVEMTLEDSGLYTYTIESFAAEANRTYGYKLRANKMWSLFELPADGNQEWTPAEAGDYKLTFTANVTDEAIDDVAAYTLKLDAEKIEVPVTHDYYIVGAVGPDVAAGTDDVIFTKAWSPGEEANKMTKGDGNTYTWEKEDVFLGKTTIYYKVAQDGTWDVSYGDNGENLTYTVTEPGTYTVQFTFNTDDNTPQIALTKTADYVITGYNVAGSSTALFGGETTWDVTANSMMLHDDGKWKRTFHAVALTAGEIEYKIAANGEWIVSYPEENAKLTIAADGTYDVTFTLDDETKEVAAVAELSKTTYTATFTTNAGWEKVYAYVFADDAPIDGVAWPGKEITATLSDGKYTYTAELTKAPTGIVFNNGDAEGIEGKTKTADLEFENGKAYDLTVAPEPEPTTYTATFDNAGNWEEVYAYAWSGEGDNVVEQLGAWPGTIMQIPVAAKADVMKEPEATADVYAITFTAETMPDFIIFNNGKTGDELEKTENLTFVDDKEYTYEEPVEPDTWTVAGAPATVFGTEWKSDDTDNDMVEQEDGTFKWEKTDLTLPAGNIEFKVVKNHAWSEAYPASNYSLNIAESGIYTITITFNPQTTDVAAVATKTGDAEVEETYVVAGSLAALFGTETMWSATAEANKMEKQDDGTYKKEYTGIVIPSDVTAVYYKIVKNGAEWIGDPANNGDNFVVSVIAGATYNFTFTFDPETGVADCVATKTADPQLNTYTATFTTDVWDEVYAYTFNPETLGTWPGTKLEKNDETGLYEVTFEAAAAPECIIFNNGNDGTGNQTADLPFVDGGEYSYEPLTGDANLDGEVTTGDAVLAVSFALDLVEPNAAQFKAADVNANGAITVSDAVGIVNIALDGTEPETDAKAFGYEANNYLTLHGQQIGLTNTTSFVAFQMDVTLTEGAVLHNVLLSQRAAGLQLATNKVGTNTWRIIAFSADKTIITGSEGDLLTIDANGELTISNIEFADADARAYELGVGNTTGIRSIDNGQLTIDNDAPMYNTAGQRVGRNYKGVVIQNGRKVAIK